MTNPTTARICTDCNNLVTTDATCPLCNEPTAGHPGSQAEESYCVGCADGPFPLRSLHLVTWNEDPYLQDEDGDLSCLCPKCVREKKRDEQCE